MSLRVRACFRLCEAAAALVLRRLGGRGLGFGRFARAAAADFLEAGRALRVADAFRAAACEAAARLFALAGAAGRLALGFSVTAVFVAASSDSELAAARLTLGFFAMAGFLAASGGSGASEGEAVPSAGAAAGTRWSDRVDESSPLELGAPTGRAGGASALAACAAATIVSGAGPGGSFFGVVPASRSRGGTAALEVSTGG